MEAGNQKITIAHVLGVQRESVSSAQRDSRAFGFGFCTPATSPTVSHHVSLPLCLCPSIPENSWYDSGTPQHTFMGANGNGQAVADQGPSKTAILISAWAVTTLVWSIFTEPHKTFPIRALLFQPVWSIRVWRNDSTWLQDLGLILSLHSVYGLVWMRSWTLPTPVDIWRIDMRDDNTRISFQIFGLLGVCGAFAGSLVFRGRMLKTEGPNRRDKSIDDAILPPVILPSRTSHSRVFPEKHSFSYSYLFVGVPVGVQSKFDNAWLRVRSADFLDRGECELGEKLRRYLHREGVNDESWAFAYLVTAPRFLGYSFNPVSFWYLYDSETHLKFMILEVNNTFDERRMYLLRTDGEENPRTRNTFTGTWNKDFHVSPFNSREGSYSLRATDPLLAFQEKGQLEIDNTIVLRSSKVHAKIVARVWSEGTPIRLESATGCEMLEFAARWWWVGLVTFPRIVWEAQKLFFRRKLRVFYRPETTEASIGREYTDDEVILEGYFRSFLEHSVGNCSEALRVIYEPAHNGGEELVFYSPGFAQDKAHSRTVTLKILSPAFYSRFVHYAHASEAFAEECLLANDKSRTMVIVGAHVLSVLLKSMRSTPQIVGWLEWTRWDLLRRLRCPPAVGSYDTRLDGRHMEDIRFFQLSELDCYVRQTVREKGAYRRTAMKLFIAQRLLFGLPMAASVCDWVVRGVLALAALAYCVNHEGIWDLLRRRDPSYVASGIGLLLANAVHIWSMLK